jgi:hypothetical protein
MKTPARSADIARALAAETPELPEDFAARVAGLAAANTAGEARWRRTDVILLCAFIGMLGLCVGGWLLLAPTSAESGAREWLAPVIAVLREQPWLLVGAAALICVQLLDFGRRVRT